MSRILKQLPRQSVPQPRSAVPVSIFFGRDCGMVPFLGFLVLMIIVLPTITLSRAGRLALALVFALTLIFGAFATIRHRIPIYLVIGLTVSAAGVDLLGEIAPSHSLPVWFRP